ncbi:hypothetical protein [Paenibacillus thalictri]|uniref:hypothetical protein n=1 Tax=Paenibacillus thalictri TaxID=2527873 RepID=UPI00103364B0|nr:hypothetical protein [Paenibacillus thalictri]
MRKYTFEKSSQIGMHTADRSYDVTNGYERRMHMAGELLFGIIVLAILAGLVCTGLWKLVTLDTTHYDLEYLWNNKFTREQLELE